MPPSGYSIRQAAAAAEFLRHCADDLEREACTHERTIMSALTAEIEHIELVLASGSQDKFAESMLRLTKTFYEALLDLAPRDPRSFREDVEAVLNGVTQEILRVHVPESLANAG